MSGLRLGDLHIPLDVAVLYVHRDGSMIPATGGLSLLVGDRVTLSGPAADVEAAALKLEGWQGRPARSLCRWSAGGTWTESRGRESGIGRMNAGSHSTPPKSWPHSRRYRTSSPSQRRENAHLHHYNHLISWVFNPHDIVDPSRCPLGQRYPTHPWL